VFVGMLNCILILVSRDWWVTALATGCSAICFWSAIVMCVIEMEYAEEIRNAPQ
jgi:hypothetical protein